MSQSLKEGSIPSCFSLQEPLLSNVNNEGINVADNNFFAESSLKTSVFNLTNATLGAGIISVPYALKEMGLILGLITVFCLAKISIISTKLLTTALDCTSAVTFEHIAELTGGFVFQTFAQTVLLIFNFGAAIGLLICCKDIFVVLSNVFGITEHVSSPSITLKIILSLVTLFVLTPLCLVEKLGQLQIASIFGLVSLQFLVVSTCITAFKQGVSITIGSFPYIAIWWPKSFFSAFRGFPLLVFAFSSQSNAPLVYHELERHTYRRMVKVATGSVVVALLTYMTIGLSGIFLYGFEIQPNILVNYQNNMQTSPLLEVAFLGVLVGIIMAFPMSIFPCKVSVISAIYASGTTDVPSSSSTIIVVFLVIGALLFALTVPSVAVVFGLMGSTCGSCIAFIFPGLFILLLRDKHPIPIHTIYRAVLMIILGVIIAVVGTTVSLKGVESHTFSL